jgi:adenosylcobinamide kinase/adenosylcobinamide-phosphate guanylyltransferase
MKVTRRCFLATCVPADAEMQDRVDRHQQDRGPEWETIECPLDISSVIQQAAGKDTVVLVDCLTLWMNNILGKTCQQDDIEQYIDQLQQALVNASGSVILVTNEVGCGIVPGDPISRLFRDMAGMANQRTAATADKVVWMVSGIPVVIKGGGR